MAVLTAFAHVMMTGPDAFAHLSAADSDAPLDPEDLDRLATVAYLIGEDAASDAARTRAHHGFLDRGDVIRAARSAYWLAFAILGRFTQFAQGGGWLARARRLLDDAGADCVEQGYCLSLAAFMKRSSTATSLPRRTCSDRPPSWVSASATAI